MRGLLPPTPLGTPPGGFGSRLGTRRSARPIAWRGRATSRNLKGKVKVLRHPTRSKMAGRSCGRVAKLGIEQSCG
eukprot:1935337-Pyramimonas_sp.AAC.1